jgi:hypothetical protein
MKKHLFLFLILFNSFLGFSQIELEANLSNQYYVGIAKLSEHGEKAIFWELFENTKVYLYNDDLSLFREFSWPADYNTSPIYPASITNKLFNLDDKIEFFINKSEGDIKTCYLLNEDGELLQSFTGYGSLTSINGKVKLVIDLDNNTEIYSLPGSIESRIEDNNENVPLPFPNPSLNKIFIPFKIPDGKKGEVHIFNLNGQLMNIIQNLNGIGVYYNTSNLNSGTYIYKVFFEDSNISTGKFVVN